MKNRSDIEKAIAIFEHAHQVMTSVVGDGTNHQIGFTRSELDAINRATITTARLIRRNTQSREALKILFLPEPLTEQRDKILNNYREIAKLKPEDLIDEPDKEVDARKEKQKTEIVVRPVYAWKKGKGSELLTLWSILATKLQVEAGV